MEDNLINGKDLNELKRLLESKINEIQNLNEEERVGREEELNVLEEDNKRLDELLAERKKYRDEIANNRKNGIKPSRKDNPSYKLYPINKELEEMFDKYDVEISKDVPEGEKAPETKEPENEIDQTIADLEKQLQEIAKRMKEYRDNGFYDQEVAEHQEYNKILEKINELKGKPEQTQENPTQQQIQDLEKLLKQSAERMAEYRRNGFYDQEAAEHQEYNKLLAKINELKNKDKKIEKSDSAQKGEPKWHPRLTPEQIEELIAEGIEPGDQEYNRYLWDHGINPFEKGKENEKTDKVEPKWHPRLTPEQIEELIAEGIEPGDQEYNRYLWDHGINPFEKGKENEKTDKVESKWHPRLTPEQIEELIAEGIEPGDQEYNRYLWDHGINPFEKGKENEKTDKVEPKWHPRLTPEQIEELIAEGIEPGDQEYNRYLWDHGINPFEKDKEKEPKGRDDDSERPEGPGGGKEDPEDDGGKEDPEDDGGKEDPEDDGGKIIGGPDDPRGGGPEPGGPKTNLPVRSFWEIYNDTCTQHVGSIARNINRFSHMKILPAKEEDTLHKVLSSILIPMKIPTKLIAKIPNALMGTDKKIQEMQDNIDDLSPEEFYTLIKSPKELKELFGNEKIKDTFDQDHLNPQFMKQYKVNNAYLDVVRSRLGREYGSAIQFYTDMAEKAYDKMKELEKIGTENWTEEQKYEYEQAVQSHKFGQAEGNKLVNELATFDDGAEKKSSAYRNISGWFLGKFNPDNREDNAQMAKLSKARREAAQTGDRDQVSILTGQMLNLSEQRTELKGGRKNYIDVGSYSIESPVETLDRGPQTKGKMLLADIAIVSAGIGIFNQVRENIHNSGLVKAHNQDIQRVNNANQNIQVSGQVKVSDSPTAPETEEMIARQTVEAGWNRAERGDLASSNWGFGSAYHARDAQSHADAVQAVNDTDKFIQQGDSLRALKKATNYYSKVQSSNSADISNYIATHPQHDYSAFSFGDTADMGKVYDFFANGVVPYNTTVNGTLASLMPAIKEGVDLNGIIFAGANALYQAQREGIKDWKKGLKVNVEQKTNNEEKEEQENNEQSQDRNEPEEQGR